MFISFGSQAFTVMATVMPSAAEAHVTDILEEDPRNLRVERGVG